MFDFMYAYPNWVVGTVFVAIAVAIAIAIMLGLRTFLPIKDDRETFDVAVRVMPTLLSITGFVLAFAIVQANGELSRAKKVVADEATSIAQLERHLLRIDPASTSAARKALASYAQSIIRDEWPLMKEGRNSFGSTVTRERLKALSHALDAVQSGDRGKALLVNDLGAAANHIEDLRDARLLEAHDAIPGLFWGVILTLTLMVMALGAFLRPSLANLVMVASQAAALGLLAAFLFLLDHPFRGQTSVTPWMLERVLGATHTAP